MTSEQYYILAEEIRADNEARQEWNRTIDEALVRGMPEEEAVDRKKELVIRPVRDSIRKDGYHAERFRTVVRSAVAILMEQVRTITVKKEKIPKVDFRKFNEMIAVRKELYRITGRIDSIEKQIRRRQEKLDSLQGLAGVFRLKLKTAMMNEITDLMEERRKQQALLDETVIRAGYWNVASFLKAYEKAKKAVAEYREYKKQHPGTRNTSGDPGRESVLKKLAEYEKEGNRKQAERTASQDSQWQLRKPAAFVDGMENGLL